MTSKNGLQQAHGGPGRFTHLLVSGSFDLVGIELDAFEHDGMYALERKAVYQYMLGVFAARPCLPPACACAFLSVVPWRCHAAVCVCVICFAFL